MFDSTPSNLPLEPMPETAKPSAPPMPEPSVMPPTMPAPTPAPRPSPVVPPSMSGKKEPEDIFAGIDKPDQEGRPMPSMAPPAPRRGSPLKGILVAMIILIVVGGAGFAAWYFFIRQDVAPTPVVTPTPAAPIVEVPPVTEPTPIPVVTPLITEPTPTATEPVTTPPAGTNIPPPTATATPTEAMDVDADGLSDPEEQLLGTNPAITDTDGDGFLDGSEVASGYDPTVPRGVLSMSVWLRKTTIGPNWSFLVPISWTLGPDTVPGDFSVQTGTPATLSFHFGTLAARQTMTEWLQQNEPTVDVSSLRSFQTKLGSAAWQTPDRLITYVVSGSHVLRIRYLLNGAVSYDYRAIYDMMLEQAIVL